MLTLDHLQDQLKKEHAVRQQMIEEAILTLHQNRECYVAQCIRQNPDINFNDYELVHERTDDSLGYVIYLRKKQNV